MAARSAQNLKDGMLKLGEIVTEDDVKAAAEATLVTA